MRAFKRRIVFVLKEILKKKRNMGLRIPKSNRRYKD
jgi:hypothetical protein